MFIFFLFLITGFNSFFLFSNRCPLSLKKITIEALASGEILPPAEITCSSGYGTCYEPEGSAHYWTCEFTGYESDYCEEPFDYM